VFLKQNTIDGPKGHVVKVSSFLFMFIVHITMIVQIEVRKCLLLFGKESSVFQFAIQKLKDQDI